MSIVPTAFVGPERSPIERIVIGAFEDVLLLVPPALPEPLLALLLELLLPQPAATATSTQANTPATIHLLNICTSSSSAPGWV